VVLSGIFVLLLFSGSAEAGGLVAMGVFAAVCFFTWMNRSSSCEQWTEHGKSCQQRLAAKSSPPTGRNSLELASEQVPPPKGNQIEWLCYHAVNEHLMTVEQCRLIADAFREQGIKENLTVFVQTAVDNGLCADAERLGKLAELAMEDAETLGPAPGSMSAGGKRRRVTLQDAG
jgi:hypothetical protein